PALHPPEGRRRRGDRAARSRARRTLLRGRGVSRGAARVRGNGRIPDRQAADAPEDSRAARDRRRSAAQRRGQDPEAATPRALLLVGGEGGGGGADPAGTKVASLRWRDRFAPPPYSCSRPTPAPALRRATADAVEREPHDRGHELRGGLRAREE